MTNLGREILEATLGNAQKLLLVPASLRPVLTITHQDGTVERRELGDVAVVPVLDMPAHYDDVMEIEDEDQ